MAQFPSQADTHRGDLFADVHFPKRGGHEGPEGGLDTKYKWDGD